jgi:very-short-patch-repair endonuclease
MNNYSEDTLSKSVGVFNDRLKNSPVENKIAFELLMQGRKDFERQYQIGNYRADFFFPENKLVLEVDGRDFHSSIKQFSEDRVRDKYINDNGYCVVRVTGVVANEMPSGVLSIIKLLKKPVTYFINSQQDIARLFISLSQSF